MTIICKHPGVQAHKSKGAVQFIIDIEAKMVNLTLFSSSHQDRGKVQNISKEFQYAYSEISHKEQRNYAALTEGPIKRFLARFVTMGVRHPGTPQPSEWKPLRYRSVVDIVSH